MDSEYPNSFREIFDCPLVLFFKGNIHILNERNMVAMIGTRHPDRDGIKICNDIAKVLAKNDVTIVSGLAQGLDSKAHTTALEEQGKTVAFIGTSLDKAYPAINRELQNKICEYGCVVSEYYVGAYTSPQAFLERNRLIAASSEAVCVIQAKDRSGTLSTARCAIEYNKHVFAVPGTIINEMYDGTNKLIQDGAEPLLKGENVLKFLGIDNNKSAGTFKIKEKPSLSLEEDLIYKSIGKGTKSTNEIYADTKIPMVRLKSLIAKMEIDDILASQSFGVYFIK